MSNFVALVVDDNESQLFKTVAQLTALRRVVPNGMLLKLAFVAPSFIWHRAKSYTEYDEIWTTDAAGVLAPRLGTDHWIAFLPFDRSDKRYDEFLANWANRRDFFQALSLIVMDCNLSGTVGDASAFFEGIQMLERLIEAGDLRKTTLKILYTGHPNLEPKYLNAVQPAMTVGEKDLSRLSAVMVAEYRRHLDRLAGRKPAGLPLQYAALFNSTSGSDVGHGLGRTLQLSCGADEKLRIAKSHMQTTANRVRMLAVVLNATPLKTATLSREVDRLNRFAMELERVDVDGPADLLTLLGAFDLAFAGAPSVPASALGTGRPLQRDRSVASFEEWRDNLTRVYLNHSESHKSWTAALRRLIRDAGKGTLDVGPDLSEHDGKIEIFVPHEWLLELFAYLQDVDGFLRHHVSAPHPVHVSVRTMKWAESPPPEIGTESGVYKASLAISYDVVEFPDLTQATVGSMNKLLSGAFAFESAAYVYDLYVVRMAKGDPARVEVFEFDLDPEDTCLRPHKRQVGLIPVWPGSGVSGHEFLEEGQTSAIVFVFESAEENCCV